MSPENSRHSLNQSDANPNPITTSSPAFSRALDSWLFFTLHAHWLFRVFYFFLIGHCDYYVNWKAFLNMNKRGKHSFLVAPNGSVLPHYLVPVEQPPKIYHQEKT